MRSAPCFLEGLTARSEERLVILTPDVPGKGIRPDVAVTERDTWREGRAPRWTPGEDGPGTPLTLTEPEILPLTRWIERRVEIRSGDGQIVTVIEVISPRNRLAGYREYRAKQDDILQSGASLVEIDLIRVGKPVMRVPEESLQREGTHYFACVYRSWKEECQFYPIPLRSRLPVIAIPLRFEDEDLPLDLQPLIDRVYEMGGYWQENYSQDPEPPLAKEESVWVRERLVGAGLVA